MITITCDHCKEIIKEVAYRMTPVAADNPDLVVTGPTYLHWKCIAPWAAKSN